MKTIKDLTKDQAIEIAKLCYPFPDYVKSEFVPVYQEHIPWSKDSEEVAESWTITFDAITMADKVETYKLQIYNWLDMYLWTYKFEKFPDRDDGVWYGQKQFPVRNQHKIQKKFIEWGIEPVPKKY